MLDVDFGEFNRSSNETAAAAAAISAVTGGEDVLTATIPAKRL